MDKFIAHILVVDDDDGIRSLVKKYLNENNFLVTTANSAEDASEKINIVKFDLIILDIMMPGKNGLEFINDHKTEQVRIIEFANIKIDLNKLLIIKNESEFKINNTEKIILEKMINNPGKTFSREDIGQLIELDKERSIDVIITRLRKKIEIDPKNPRFLQTIRGVGYVLWIE
jgi:two-component system phosphate regulon response regulator OmpR